jgi:hypothetical protein
VPTEEYRDVPETKLVEVPTGKFRVEEEEYEEWEEREIVKPKEIWVKRIVEVPVKERVPVRKTRQVQVPECVYEERTEYRKEKFETKKKVTVPAMQWKVVQGTKWVDVTELRECRVEPVMHGRAVIKQMSEVHGTFEHVPNGDEKFDGFVEGSVDYAAYARDEEQKRGWRSDAGRGAYGGVETYQSTHGTDTFAAAPGANARVSTGQYSSAPYSASTKPYGTDFAPQGRESTELYYGGSGKYAHDWSSPGK